ncbi:GTP pyrophosphokinase family protein [Exiguobacterium sp. SH3S2]|uniref:GTP pyrophosphokinase n=1 Tax=unclassified Exiguobacterium TaxID=2644629 RepID=UPI00103AD353|nr:MULTISPECIES: GTP pyrophosphokinase family protein [unclassified Exiguobacterium]TCI26535.1 GTP pyrophosphokinase family protein [Exiguobacterium sp. SH5S4]TCI49094.1 GTP pyrophosphokinase family protein [Exiguobacterium sp. SH3S3]TCI58114.1 GTP pyrophosphokinase family protein [Exiguobacterium sp. SH5S13]TCI64407.1 GTP pyrophosphokinase family protein [Exiguobacterium sp. SH3S2]TCI66267.1 GTP pyrophosphokinase family protein [Exiguobacterium sp. SH3S1]
MQSVDWDQFLVPYQIAVDELKVKFKAIRKQYNSQNDHSPIEFVTGRVKPVGSILEKAKRKQIAYDHLSTEMQDIAGLRIMCQFVDDIVQVLELLHHRTDFKIVEERNYITNQKKSGYRSYHIIIEYPVQTIHGEFPTLVEVQVRTLAMNFWATIEHSLNYKYDGDMPQEVQERLRRAAEAAFLLDAEMSQLRVEIQDAQQVFRDKEMNVQTDQD